MVQDNLERANNQYNGSTKQVLDGSLSAEEIKAKELLNKTDIEGAKGEIVDKFNNTSDSTIIRTGEGVIKNVKETGKEAMKVYKEIEKTGVMKDGFDT